MKFKKIVTGLLSVLLLYGTSVPAYAAAASDGIAVSSRNKRIDYENIASIVRSGNETIRANQKTLDSLKSNDVAEQARDELAESRDRLKEVSDQLQSAYDAIEALPAPLPEPVQAGPGQQAPDEQQPDQQGTVQEAVKASLQGSIASIEAIRGILSSQRDQLKVSDDTIDRTELQIDAAADQIVVAAQKLFVTYHYLEAERARLLKQQQVLARTLEIAELQVKLGFLTETELLNLRQQDNALADSLATLANRINMVKNNFRVQLGYPTDYEIWLSALPEPDKDFAKKMDATADRRKAQRANRTLKEKELEKEIADDNRDSDLDSTEDDYRAAVLNYSLALKTFDASFQQVYNDVAEKQNLVTSAQAAYDAKARALDAVKLQYALGVVSAMDLENAEMDLENAQAALNQANSNLFSSQEQYRWALRGVISTSSAQDPSVAQE